MADGDVLVIYLDDNDKKLEQWVKKESLEITEGIVKFKTNSNVIIIPVTRLIKIRERREGE